MKKNFLFVPLLALAVSCGENSKPADQQKNVDSAITAQENSTKPIAPQDIPRSTDTVKMVALPPVMEGDIIFQTWNSDQSDEMEEASGSKYNSVGLVFIRKTDNQYMVVEMRDSLRATPLSEWVSRGKDQHVLLMRLKNSNQILSAKKTNDLRNAVRTYHKMPYDYALSWGDDAMYGSELVWKIYHNALKIDLCPTKQLKDLNTKSGRLKTELGKKYGKNIPLTDPAVTPD
ncbi:MAG TPA: YiiX/YebB-like N1pC/P60 family cysteine hydrolase, partial [Bacteroidia bacterium]|nr:YiiX/YebB-like N1pC/P60 family cysteine hydrolase [Bacteroidia bacterium]